MMNYRKFWLLLLVLCIPKANACLLTVHTIEYPPLSSKNQNGQWVGLSIDYLDELFNAANCKYELIDVPLARALLLMEEGKLDAALNISVNKDREKYLYFVGPQRQEVIKFVSAKDRVPMVTTWQEFEELDARLVWQTGADFGNKAREIINNSPLLSDRLLYTVKNDVMVSLVNKGRADGFFVEANFFSYMKKNDPDYQNLEEHPLIVNAENVYFAFSKKSVSQEIVNKLVKAYEQLVNSGAFLKIETAFSNPS